MSPSNTAAVASMVRACIRPFFHRSDSTSATQPIASNSPSRTQGQPGPTPTPASPPPSAAAANTGATSSSAGDVAPTPAQNPSANTSPAANGQALSGSGTATPPSPTAPRQRLPAPGDGQTLPGQQQHQHQHPQPRSTLAAARHSIQGGPSHAQTAVTPAANSRTAMTRSAASSPVSTATSSSHPRGGIATRATRVFGLRDAARYSRSKRKLHEQFVPVYSLEWEDLCQWLEERFEGSAPFEEDIVIDFYRIWTPEELTQHDKKEIDKLRSGYDPEKDQEPTA